MRALHGGGDWGLTPRWCPLVSLPPLTEREQSLPAGCGAGSQALLRICACPHTARKHAVANPPAADEEHVVSPTAAKTGSDRITYSPRRFTLSVVRPALVSGQDSAQKHDPVLARMLLQGTAGVY